MYTSFSGSHQDAIKKAFAARRESDIWEMPYLPIDPKDVGRSYEAVIRVNSQSGKGGISYLLEAEFGLTLPRRLSIELSQAVQAVTDASGKEVTAEDIWGIFRAEYLDSTAPYGYVEHELTVGASKDEIDLSAQILHDGDKRSVRGRGNGPIDAFVRAVGDSTRDLVRVLDYSEHSVGAGANATAIAYIEMRVGDGPMLYGVGMDANIVTASLKAIVSGLNRESRRLKAQTSAAVTP